MKFVVQNDSFNEHSIAKIYLRNKMEEITRSNQGSFRSMRISPENIDYPARIANSSFLRIKSKEYTMPIPEPQPLPKYERLNENLLKIQEIKKLASDTQELTKSFKSIVKP